MVLKQVCLQFQSGLLIYQNQFCLLFKSGFVCFHFKPSCLFTVSKLFFLVYILKETCLLTWKEFIFLQLFVYNWEELVCLQFQETCLFTSPRNCLFTIPRNCLFTIQNRFGLHVPLWKVRKGRPEDAGLWRPTPGGKLTKMSKMSKCRRRKCRNIAAKTSQTNLSKCVERDATVFRCRKAKIFDKTWSFLRHGQK